MYFVVQGVAKRMEGMTPAGLVALLKFSKGTGGFAPTSNDIRFVV